MFYVERHCSAMAAGKTGRCSAELPCLTVWVSPEQKPTGWAVAEILCLFLTTAHPALRGREVHAHLSRHHPQGKLLGCASTERCPQRLSLFLRLRCHTGCCKKQAFWAQPLFYTENVLCDNKRTSSSGWHF